MVSYMLIFCLISFILLIVVTKIEFRVINVLNDTDVYIKIGIIKIHMDYDRFIESINKVVKETNVSFSEFKKGLGIYSIAKNILNNSDVNIKKCNIVKKNNTFNIFNIYLNTTYYTVGMYIKNFLIVNTQKQGDISFYVIPSTQNDIDVDIDVEFSLFSFLKSFLFNINNIIKLKRI